MTPSFDASALLLEQAKVYPLFTPQDVYKLLYQAAFGCEHLIASPCAVEERLAEEYAAAAPYLEEKIESLGDGYGRLYLGYMKKGLTAKTIAGLLLASAKKEDGVAALEKGLTLALSLAKEGKLPFSAEALLAEWEMRKREGYPSCRHSEAYRAAYHPAYRVVANRYLLYLPLLLRLDRMLAKGRVVLAIEGGSAAGKTTLAALLERLYGATVLHMDDYFLRPTQRTRARLSEPGGNVDRERVLSEILLPLSQGASAITYAPYSCQSGALLPPVTVTPTPLTVIEGAYSMHPLLQPYYTLSVFLDVPPSLQRERIKKRNTPQHAKRFFEEWIPMEEAYRQAFAIQEKCDIVIPVQ
ncbi:MAG: hypothetical protein IJY71_00790 [Clostridia bacterium]|nr:hypothetical protein [Clostridia bacterium]